ncbi:MAG: hypothetical protein AAGJ93_00775 [Bacteroidota bacterium]
MERDERTKTRLNKCEFVPVKADRILAWDKANKLSPKEKISFGFFGVLDCIMLLSTYKWDKNVCKKCDYKIKNGVNRDRFRFSTKIFRKEPKKFLFTQIKFKKDRNYLLSVFKTLNFVPESEISFVF